MKQRLDQALVSRGLVTSRSQAASYIKLGEAQVNQKIITKAGWLVNASDKLELTVTEHYVSRAGLKLASVAAALKLDFQAKTVLDVGSSTGGFSDYALRRGAKRVIAVDVGSHQLHSDLRNDPRVELHEKTDIRAFNTNTKLDIVLVDVSFISLREILPAVAELSSPKTQILAMVKPQFEAAAQGVKHKGVVKNDHMRRDILKSFEDWAKPRFIIVAKADSAVSGAQGNLERFYLLRKA